LPFSESTTSRPDNTAITFGLILTDRETILSLFLSIHIPVSMSSLKTDEYIERVKQHRLLHTRWKTEKEALSRHLAIVTAEKAAAALVKFEVQERIYALQRLLGLPAEISFNSVAAPAPAPTPKPATGRRGGKRQVKKRSVREDLPMSTSAPLTILPSVLPTWTYKPRHEIAVHLDCVRALCFHESHPIVVTASDDGTIRIVNQVGKLTVNRKVVRSVVNIASLRGVTRWSVSGSCVRRTVPSLTRMKPSPTTDCVTCGYMRMPFGRSRLSGDYFKGTCNVLQSFAVPFDEDSSVWFVDTNFI
jgi:WD40 repeat protein